MNLIKKLTMLSVVGTLTVTTLSPIYANADSSDFESESSKTYVTYTSDDVKISSNLKYNSEGKYTKEFFKNEICDSTGLLDDELEQKLNEMGVVDDDLYNWKTEDINGIKNATEIQVQVKYADETGLEITPEEYFEDYTSEDENNDSFIEKGLKSLGILPINVYADANDESHTNKFRQTLVTYNIACNSSGEPRIKYVYTGDWDKTPVYNNLDYVILSFSNGYIHSSNFTNCYSATFYPTYLDGKPLYSSIISSTKDYKNYYKSQGATSYEVYSFDLPGGKYGIEYSDEADGRYDYEDYEVVISGVVDIWDDKNNKISANASYYHFESFSKVAIKDITLTSSGNISVKLSFTNKNYYHLLGTLSVVNKVAKIYK